MAYVEILCKNESNKYDLICKPTLSIKKDGVVFSVRTVQLAKRRYLLRTDIRFKTVKLIVDCLNEIMEQIIQNNYILKIREDFERCYVWIGYDETNSEFKMLQFTAHLMS